MASWVSVWAIVAIGALQSVSFAKGPLVTKPVPGLYESTSISKDKQPAGLKLVERFVIHEQGQEKEFRGKSTLRRGITATTHAWTADGKEAVFERVYFPETRRLRLLAAYLNNHGERDQGVPRWVQGDGVELVKDKGVPTQVYVTMRQMRRMGVPYGGLDEIYTLGNINVESTLNIPEIRRRGIPIEDAVRQTATYRYMETLATQTGHRVLSLEVYERQNGVVGADLLRDPRFAERTALRAYSVVLKLAPIDPRPTETPSLHDKTTDEYLKFLGRPR